MLNLSNRRLTQVAKKESWGETHKGIKFMLILYIGFKNLKMGRMRTLLTIGGVSLGIGIITFLLCIGFGVQKMIVTEVTKNNPLDVIDVNNGNLDNFISLNDESIEKIENLDGVKKVERRVNTGGKVMYGESQTDVVVYGANQEYIELARVSYRLTNGNFSNGENKVLISDRLANLLGFSDPMEAVGKTIKYNIALTKEVSSTVTEEKVSNDNETEIVGIVTGDEGVFIYIPFDVARDNFGIDLAQNGKVVVGDMAKFDTVKLQLEQLGFLTESINELIKDIDSFFTTVRAVLVIFGIIIMSISVMGMLNTLSISLLQRTKEIGILKALGTRRFDIFKMFIIESIIISFIGGAIGLLGGYGLSIAVNYLLMYLGKRAGVELFYFVYMPSYFVVAVVGFIFFLGVATGIMPAFRAAKIHALEALRYE